MYIYIYWHLQQKLPKDHVSKKFRVGEPRFCQHQRLYEIIKLTFVRDQLIGFHHAIVRTRRPAKQLRTQWVCCCLFGVFFSVFVWWWGAVGWGGMLTFTFMLRWWCCVDHGVGWGGMLTFMFMLHWNCSMVEIIFEKIWEVKKQACKAACAVTLASARKPL